MRRLHIGEGETGEGKGKGERECQGHGASKTGRPRYLCATHGCLPGALRQTSGKSNRAIKNAVGSVDAQMQCRFPCSKEGSGGMGLALVLSLLALARA